MFIGSIILWAGLEASIPAGWQIADGTNGTHDMRSEFVKGANNDGHIGDIAGVNTHVHTFESNDHGHALNLTATGPIPAAGTQKYEVSLEAVDGTTDSTAHTPEHIKLYYIQKVA